jgi:tetratricopeptide (TPR) repeat protein
VIEVRISPRWHSAIIPALLTAAVFAVYGQCWSFGFVDWDDPVFITGNAHIQTLSLTNIWHVLTPGAISGEWLYVPLPYLTFMAEAVLFDLSPQALHITNTLFHLANTILLLFFVQRLTGSRITGGLTALLFAVHPLQVETVAWCMGRKDLMATFFCLTSLLIYQRFLNYRTPTRYTVSLLLFACALLCKPAVAAVPLIFLLLDYKARHYLDRSDLLTKTPFFAVSALAVWVNLALAPDVGGMSVADNLTRLAHVPWLATQWLGRILMLSAPDILYLPQSLTSEGINLAVCVVWLLIAGALVCGHRERLWWPVTGVVAGLIIFLPSANIFFSNKVFITADRYGYLPLVGLFLAVAALRHHLPSRLLIVHSAIILAIAGIAGVKAHKQAAVWHDTGSLWEYAAQRNPNNAFAWDALGRWYNEKENNDEKLAEQCFRRALEVEPFYYTSHGNLAQLFARTNRDRLAVRHFELATTIYPEAVDIRMDEGQYHFARGQLEQALHAFAEAARIDNRNAVAWHNAGYTAHRLGRPQEAIRYLQLAVAANPERVESWYLLGEIHLGIGEADAALVNLQVALRHNPVHRESRLNAAVAYQALGQREAAFVLLRKLAGEEPGYLTAQFKFAVLAHRMHHHDDALKAYRRVLTLNPAHRETIYNMVVLLHGQDRHRQVIRTIEDEAGALEYDAIIHAAVGRSYLQVGKLAEARKHLYEAAKVDVKSAALQFDLVRVEIKLGNLEAAREHLQNARALGGKPDPGLLDELRNQ